MYSIIQNKQVLDAVNKVKTFNCVHTAVAEKDSDNGEFMVVYWTDSLSGEMCAYYMPERKNLTEVNVRIAVKETGAMVGYVNLAYFYTLLESEDAFANMKKEHEELQNMVRRAAL